MDKEKIINSTVNFVKETLKNAESGHDWFHIERVWRNSIKIFNSEKIKHESLNLLKIELGALLHDIADHKFNSGDDTKGSIVAKEFLFTLDLEPEIIDSVCNIVSKISFKGSKEKNLMDSIEGKIVQDADRLDAIGAVGISRAFSYGGFRKRQIYDPLDKPNENMNWEEYKKSSGCTINHFYEKLLLIKNLMNTESGKKLAEKRHDYMQGFLTQFFNEWDGME